MVSGGHAGEEPVLAGEFWKAAWLDLMGASRL